MYLNSLNEHLKSIYGCKVYKLSLSSGCSCPNRDGTLGTKGCIFCDGAGFFTAAGSIPQQLKEAKERLRSKIGTEVKYIAYFQSFTNTYASPEVLLPLFKEAMAPDDVVALSIATRPDCLGPDILAMLSELKKLKPVWVELGLQTIHPVSAEYIRRGYDLPVFAKAVGNLKALGITVIVHEILGLPGETAEDMIATARYIGQSGADGIKLHLLHVLRGTDLAKDYEAGKFQALELDEYIKVLEECLKVLPKEVVIHRLTGDGPKRDLIAPLWSGNKKLVLNSIHKALKEDNIEQGSGLYET